MNGPDLTVPATPELDELQARLDYWAEGYRLGFAAGQQIGFRQGENAEAELWSDALGLVRRAAAGPSAAELARIRAEDPIEPCPVRCRSCSRCIRSLSYWSRGARDFLGVEAERLLQVAS